MSSLSESYGSVHTSAGDQAISEITQFRGNFEFLSNFYPSVIVQGGLAFPTVEHAFQAAKCLDQQGKLSILAQKSPTMAKRVGRRVSLRPDWERVKVDLMHEILRLKFAPGSELKAMLEATGEARIVEGNTWHDNFWGSCMCTKHGSIPGVNILGKLLMQIRGELRSSREEVGDPSDTSVISRPVR